MFKRVWKVVHPLLTLAAVGCCMYLLLRPTPPMPTGRAGEDADRALRMFSGVRWIGGDYELPADERFAVIALLEFKDGAYKRNYYSRVWDVEQEGRVLRPLFMWGDGPQGKRAAFIDGVGTLFTGVTTYTGEFAELDGPSGQVNGPIKCEEVRGFRAVGYASSEGIRAGHERVKGIGGLKCSETIESRKRVLVLGVKPVSDKATAEQCVNELNAEPSR